MLRRLLSVTIAFLGTLIAVVVYWFVFMPWLPFPIRSSPWIKLVLAMIGLIIAMYLFRRWRNWSALLVLIGSVPVLLVNISLCGWIWRMNRNYFDPSSEDHHRLAWLFPGDNEPSPVNSVLHYLFFFSEVCLPIAFFVIFFRLADAQLATRWQKNACQAATPAKSALR
jgi:hypothetical protein